MLFDLEHCIAFTVKTTSKTTSACRGMAQEASNYMNYSLILIMISMILSLPAGNVSSMGCSDNIVFDGKGAGQVVFNATVHTSKGIPCSDCHEARGLSFALFEMKKGSDTITMRKLRLGSSCGYCHDGKKAFSVTDYLDCSKCHHKT